MRDDLQAQDGGGFEKGNGKAFEDFEDGHLKEPEPGLSPKSEKKSKKSKKERRKSKSKKAEEVEDTVDYPVLPKMLEDENIAPEENLPADMATDEVDEAPAVAPKDRRKSRKGKSDKAATIQDLFEDEEAAPEESAGPPAEVPKSGKKSRKVNGAPRRRTRATPDVIEPLPAPLVQDDAVEEEDMVAALNKARALKNKLEITNPRRSKRISSVEAEVSNVSTRARSREISIDHTPLPALKAVKAKSRTSTRKSRKDIYDVPEDDGDSAAALHQPTSRTKQRVASRSEREASAVSPIMEEVEEEELPKKPSKKSLGKRKASGTSVVTSSKKRKRNDKAPAGTPPLYAFGFHSDDSAKSGPQREITHSILNPTSEILASTAQRLYAEAEDSSENSPPPSPLRPIDPVSSQPRKSTQWTPINSPEEARAVIRPPPPKYQVQAQVQINSRVPSERTSPSPASEAEIPVPKSSEKKRKRRIPTVEPSSAIKPASSRGRTSVPKAPPSRKVSSAASKSRRGSSLAPMSEAKRRANEELESIFEAVEEWRVGNDMTPKEINELVQRKINSEVTKFWDHIAAQTPGLTRIQIQQKCRRKFHNFDRGPWTEEEDTELRDLYEKTPGKWVQIGPLLNRFPEDCRDRWRNYVVCGDKQRKDTWDKEEEDNLRVVVAECIEKIKEERHKKGESKKSVMEYENLLDWGTVSKEMGHTRSRLQCSNKWRQLKERMESDVEDPVAETPISENWRLEEAESEARRMSAQQKLELLYAIRETAAGSEGKIPWVVVTREHLKVRGMRMAYKICYRTMKQHIEGHEDMKLQEIIGQLIDAYEEAAPSEPKGFQKTFAASQQRIESRNSKTPQKRMKRKGLVDPDSSDNDNGEGPSMKFPASQEAISSRNLDDHGSKPEDMETPRPTKRVKSKAKPKVNGKSKGTKSDMIEEMGNENENENVEISAPKPKKKKRKLKQRMKQIDEKVSQETNEEAAPVVPSDDDLEDVISSMKTGNSRTPRRSSQEARRNLNQQLSNEHVQSSDEGGPEREPEASLVDETRLEDDDESDFAPGDHQSHPEDEDGNPLAQEESDAIEESESEDLHQQNLVEEEQDNYEDSGLEDQHQGNFAAEIEESQPEANGGYDDQDINSLGDYTAPGGPGDDQDEVFPNEEEELTPSFHDHASVDLDADNDDEPRIIMNGWNRRDDPESSQEEEEEEEEDDEEEEEEQRGRSLTRRSPSKKLGSQLSFSHRDATPRANGYTNGYTNGNGKARDSALSSEGSMSDIPASVPEWKLKGIHNREMSAEL